MVGALALPLLLLLLATLALAPGEEAAMVAVVGPRAHLGVETVFPAPATRQRRSHHLFHPSLQRMDPTPVGPRARLGEEVVAVDLVDLQLLDDATRTTPVTNPMSAFATPVMDTS